MGRTLIGCKDCGWTGTLKECVCIENWNERIGRVETETSCPKCGSKNLIVIKGRLVPV